MRVRGCEGVDARHIGTFQSTRAPTNPIGSVLRGLGDAQAEDEANPLPRRDL